MYIHVFRKKKSSSVNSHAIKKPPPVKPYASQKSTQHQPVHYEPAKDAVVVPAKGLYVPCTLYTHVHVYLYLHLHTLKDMCI